MVARRVIIHVGTMKSGTTSLQHALFAHRERLAELGILVPGASWRAQVDAVWDVRGRSRSLAGDRSLEGSWDRLVAEIDAWPGTAVVSAELFAPAGADVVERVARSFAAAEIVLSVRDLNRNLPAMWQEVVQNGEFWTWPDFLAAAHRLRPRWSMPDLMTGTSRFWKEQDAAAIARRWGAVGPVHVVTVPPPGGRPEALLDRFGGVIGFGFGDIRTPASRNASLGVVRTEVLRRLNVELKRRGLRFPAGIRLRKHVLAKRLMRDLDVDDQRLGLRVAPWVEKSARQQVTVLRRQGVVLHGDWADLAPVEVSGADSATVAEDRVAAVAAAVHVPLREWLLERAVSGPRPGWGPETVPRWSPGGAGRGGDGADDAVGALADLIEWAITRTRAKQATNA